MQRSSPLYRKIANKIKDEIKAGNWQAGESIPTEKHLADSFEASRVTIRQAINLLVTEGLLYKIQGSGTYVTENKIEHDIFELQGFTEEMRRLKKEPDNRILKFQIEEPEKRIRGILKLKEGEQVFFVKRQRLIDNIPFVVEKTYLPVQLFPDLTYEVMTLSKYEYIEKKKGLKIKESFQEVLPILPEGEMIELLQLSGQTPILNIQLYSVLEDDTVFEYTELFFKSDQYKFKLKARR